MKPIIDINLRRIASKNQLFELIFIIFASLIIFSWLYYKSENISSIEHNQHVETLRSTQQVNAQVDAEILASRMELSRNYDALTKYTLELNTLSQAILKTPQFIKSDEREKVIKHSKKLLATIKTKTNLIEEFKRENSILRNSLAYFQTAANNLYIEGEHFELLEDYIKSVLFFTRTPSHSNLKKLNTAHQKLKKSIEEKPRYKKLKNLISHGSIIKNYQPNVDNLIKKILLLDTNALLNEINHNYLTIYNKAKYNVRVYRYALYILTIILILYLAYTFLTLEKTRRKLAQAHKEVLERYEAQKRAEKALQLHDTAFKNTYEAIMITDIHRNIIEVNPAFTRITGYTRDEVLGKNPRILQSGRHDGNFYKNLWQSVKETGSWRGEIWNKNKSGEIFPEMLSITSVKNKQNEVSNYVAVFSDISHIKKQEQQLQKMAHFDALTNLPNRVLLQDRIHQAQSQIDRDNSIMAVCFLDLDGFKPINDNYGHEAGDQILVEVAKRFEQTLRSVDTVSRLGGDEFVLLLVGLNKTEECELFLQRIMQSLNQPFSINGNQITLSASIGVTFYPSNKTDADSLLRHADHAMYQAKQQGKNGYIIFDPDKDNLVRNQNERLQSIEKALENNEFTIFYQPKVDLRHGSVYGIEALIRWQHPQKGMLPPNHFLPITEDTYLSKKIGDWVIESVFKQMELWLQQGLELQTSINVTSKQLHDPNFVDELNTELLNHPTIKPEMIELEVLETAALEDIVKISEVINNCKKIGVQFALDDFGTGYSSLTYLKRLPADTLKIDISFVKDMIADPENLAIVHGVMGLATAFQKKIIAEGVETIEHGRILMQLGCDYAQGYAIAKPMPADELEHWIADWVYPKKWKSIQHLYWTDQDYPLLAAKIQLKHWVDLLLYSIETNKTMSQELIGEAKSSKFGQWYHHLGFKRYGHFTPAYDELGEDYEKLHQLAKQIHSEMQAGNDKKAKSLIPNILHYRDTIISKLQQINLSFAYSEKKELSLQFIPETHAHQTN